MCMNSQRRGRQSADRDLFRSSSYFPLLNYMFSSIIEAKLKLVDLCSPIFLYRLNLPFSFTWPLLPRFRPSPSAFVFPSIFDITNRSIGAIPALRESKENENKPLLLSMINIYPSWDIKIQEHRPSPPSFSLHSEALYNIWLLFYLQKNGGLTNS